MSNHTPGPWRVERTHAGMCMGVSSPSTWKHDLDMLATLPYTENQHNDHIEANTNLIAAAPDLLAAAKLAQALMAAGPALEFIKVAITKAEQSTIKE